MPDYTGTYAAPFASTAGTSPVVEGGDTALSDLDDGTYVDLGLLSRPDEGVFTADVVQQTGFLIDPAYRPPSNGPGIEALTFHLRLSSLTEDTGPNIGAIVRIGTPDSARGTSLNFGQGFIDPIVTDGTIQERTANPSDSFAQYGGPLTWDDLTSGAGLVVRYFPRGGASGQPQVRRLHRFWWTIHYDLVTPPPTTVYDAPWVRVLQRSDGLDLGGPPRAVQQATRADSLRAGTAVT